MIRGREEFLGFLREKGIRFTEPDEHSVRIVWQGANIYTLPIVMRFDGDGRPIATADCYELCHVSAEKRDVLTECCSVLNERYRWVKFYLDEDDDIVTEIVIPLPPDGTGRFCMDMMLELRDITDHAYPFIMTALWGLPDASDRSKAE
ncbi:MAG: YbjN domain-containing protein [Mailhella sp.]|nr:YbjN domain-containing protein [Mailhella sp.]